MRNIRDRNEKEVPTHHAIHQRRRVRWRSIRDMKVARWKNRPLLSREEWDCLAGEMTRGEYMNAPAEVIWMWAIRKKLVGCSSRYN